MFASVSGTIIEWYDYSLYGAAAGLAINKLYFPNLSPTIATMAAFLTFAVGFVSRPLGGVIIAHIGDRYRYGRKPALIFAVIRFLHVVNQCFHGRRHPLILPGFFSGHTATG